MFKEMDSAKLDENMEELTMCFLRNRSHFLDHQTSNLILDIEVLQEPSTGHNELVPNYFFWFSKGCALRGVSQGELYVKDQHVVSRSNMIVSLRRFASLKSDVDAIAKTALVLKTSTDDKKLIKLGARLITIDDIREEIMKNHAMLEADDK